MDKSLKNKIDSEDNAGKIKKEEEARELEVALEKVRQKATIVNIEEIAESEARKGADAYMTEDKASGLKKWWKHTVAEGFYRQREVKRVQKEIKETGNIYTRRIGDDPTKPAHESAMKGIADRFKADYEDELILSEGEERKFLDDKDPKAIKVKTDLKNLLDSYAMGNIDDETFNNSKKGIIDSLKEKEDLFKGADNYADNLFEIAQNAKTAYDHGVKLGELDYDLGMIVGKAKSSLKTEAHFNWVDKGIDKMKKNGVGKFISPTVLSTGVGIAYSVMTGVNALASTKAGQILGGIGSLGITVGISTAFAAANESQRVADERKQHGLEMAEGGEYKKGDKRREQMAKYEYAMEKSTDLSQKLRDLMFEKDKDGNDVVKDIKEGDVQDIITCLGNIDARKSLNASKKIDLISYSNVGNVEKESTDLTILTAKAKFELEKRVKTDLKNGLPQGAKSYEEYLESVTNTVKDSLLGGEKGIDAQDKTYRWYKTKRVASKAFWTATIGIIAGTTIRELMTIGSDHVQGLFNNPDGTTTVTPARHLWDIMTGNQTHMDMGNSTVFDIGNHNYEFPEGVSGLQNGNVIDVVKGGQVIYSFIPKYDANGLLDPTLAAKLAHDGILSSGIHNVINSTQEVATDANGWIQNHPGETIQVHHVQDAPFLDNNTPSIPDSANPGHMLGANGNELGMQWGGINGTGLNANEDVVLNISNMNSIDSFHGDVAIDVPQEMQNGNLMAIIYLNGGGTGIPVEVQPSGDIIFDHNNPIMQQVFTQDANGHMVSHAKVIELVQKMGLDKNGVQQVRGISAIVGEGLKSIKDIIPCYDDITVNTLIPPTDVQSMLFVPTVSRKPLEPVIFGGKDKKTKDKNGENKEGNQDMALNDETITTDISKKEITDDEIKDRAQKIYEERIKIANPEADWSEAERQLKEEQNEKIKEIEKEITDQEKSNRAYELYEKRLKEGKEGNQNDDWFEAERQLKKEQEDKIKEIRKEIAEEEKANRAKKIYEERMKSANPEADWSEAERQLKEEQKNNPKELENKKESSKKIDEIKTEIKKTIEASEKSIVNEPRKKNLTEIKNKFTEKDLLKVGTEFDIGETHYIVSRIEKSFLGFRTKIIVDTVNKKDDKIKQMAEFTKKDLKERLKNNTLKITKVKAGK